MNNAKPTFTLGPHEDQLLTEVSEELSDIVQHYGVGAGPCDFMLRVIAATLAVAPRHDCRPWSWRDPMQKRLTEAEAKLTRPLADKDKATAGWVAADDELTIVKQLTAALNPVRQYLSERIRETKRQQKARGEYLGGPAPFGWVYDEQKRLVPVPEQQSVCAGSGSSPPTGSARTKDQRRSRPAKGVKLSHMGVRKVLARAGA